MQFLPSTFAMWSKDVMGYVPTFTEVSEKYVALRKVDEWLAQGYDARQIFLIWNQGHAGKCKRGTNKYGARFDSCTYAQKGLLAIKK